MTIVAETSLRTMVIPFHLVLSQDYAYSLERTYGFAKISPCSELTILGLKRALGWGL
jgi:hypothetical protein